MFRIINRYIFREMISIFGISLVVFTFILLVAKIFALTDMVVNKGIPLVALGRLIAYKLPYFFVFTFPMSTLMASLITFLRLSHDSEVTAMRATGLSLYQLLPPVVALSILTYASTSFMSVYALPSANRAFKGLVRELTQQKAYVGITPRIFNDDFKGMVLYVNSLDPSGRFLENVFISDERDPDLSHAIVAREGRILADPQSGTTALRLIDGEIHYDSKDLRSSDTVRFETYELALRLPEFSGPQDEGELGESEMSLRQLSQRIIETEKHDVKYNATVVEFHEKFAVPFSCLILGLVGMAVGVQAKSHGHSAGVGVALGIFLLYYILLSAAKSLGESGTLPAAPGMWLPNLLVGALGAFMFYGANRGTPMLGIVFLERFAARIRAAARC